LLGNLSTIFLTIPARFSYFTAIGFYRQCFDPVKVLFGDLAPIMYFIT